VEVHITRFLICLALHNRFPNYTAAESAQDPSAFKSTPLTNLSSSRWLCARTITERLHFTTVPDSNPYASNAITTPYSSSRQSLLVLTTPFPIPTLSALINLSATQYSRCNIRWHLSASSISQKRLPDPSRTPPDKSQTTRWCSTSTMIGLLRKHTIV